MNYFISTIVYVWKHNIKVATALANQYANAQRNLIVVVPAGNNHWTSVYNSKSKQT